MSIIIAKSLKEKMEKEKVERERNKSTEDLYENINELKKLVNKYHEENQMLFKRVTELENNVCEINNWIDDYDDYDDYYATDKNGNSIYVNNAPLISTGSNSTVIIGDKVSFDTSCHETYSTHRSTSTSTSAKLNVNLSDGIFPPMVRALLNK